MLDHEDRNISMVICEELHVAKFEVTLAILYNTMLTHFCQGFIPEVSKPVKITSYHYYHWSHPILLILWSASGLNSVT